MTRTVLLLITLIATQTPTAPSSEAPQRSGTRPAQAAPAVQPPAAQTAQAPPATDIWLARLDAAGTLMQPPINITNRPGYDNQPSFTPDGKTILFTRSDGKQTDIYAYDFTSRSSGVRPITNTPESEYSPTVTPDGTGMSVIRVEADGTQRLWRFALGDATRAGSAGAAGNADSTAPQVVLPNVRPVGYHAWGPDGLLALFVLGNPNTLQVADSRTGRSRVAAQRIGRSLHPIPGRDTVSVLHLEGGARWIKELDLRTRALTPIATLPEGGEGDYAWSPDGAILMSDGARLMRWRAGATEWAAVADLAALGLAGVTRLAVSPDGRWIAMVAPEAR